VPDERALPPEKWKALADRLSRSAAISRYGEDEAEALVHALSDLEDAYRAFLDHEQLPLCGPVQPTREFLRWQDREQLVVEPSTQTGQAIRKCSRGTPPPAGRCVTGSSRSASGEQGDPCARLPRLRTPLACRCRPPKP
jgi:hypothetical protein